MTANAEGFAGAHKHPTPAAVDAATGAREALLLRMAALIADLALDTWNRKDARTVDAMDVLHTLRELPTPSHAASPDASGTPPSASPEACDCGCNSAEDADGKECACDCHDPDTPKYRDIPSASPEADKRMWLVSRDVESGELGVINLVTQASRDRTDQEWQRMCQYSTDHVRVVPLSELARVQRERDETKDTALVRQGQIEALRARLAAVQKYARETLDRARVAEQRIEMSETVIFDRTWAKRNGYYVATNGDCTPSSGEWTRILDALSASHAETLGLREERDALLERLDASATGMATLNDRIAELERDKGPFPCSVCVGSGKPVSGKPCICDGVGTEAAEMHGLRVLAFQQAEHIAALESEAQDVKRVEAWEKAGYGYRLVESRDGVWSALDCRESRPRLVSRADSLAALGRMLKEGE